MKPKTLDANQPWIPGHWVVDGKAIDAKKFDDASRRKYCTVKIDKLIERMCRHED